MGHAPGPRETENSTRNSLALKHPLEDLFDDCHDPLVADDDTTIPAPGHL